MQFSFRLCTIIQTNNLATNVITNDLSYEIKYDQLGGSRKFMKILFADPVSSRLPVSVYY